MNIVFYYFSGTGNTARVCRLLSEEAAKLGHETELISIVGGAAEKRDCDCMVVGYPVHAFNAPAPLLKFLKSLERTAHGTPVYLAQVSGEPLKMNAAAYILPRRILKKRGYNVLGGFHYVMPYNIIFRHSDAAAARMWNVCKIRAPEDAANIVALAENKIKVNALRRAASFALRIEHIAMPVVGRRFKPKKNCIGCGLCEKVCPQNNIMMKDGKPKFGKNCAACMGCSFSCPQNAVKISILQGWRVNGKYDFNAAPAADGEIGRYCRKSYLKYFHKYEDFSDNFKSDGIK